MMNNKSYQCREKAIFFLYKNLSAWVQVIRLRESTEVLMGCLGNNSLLYIIVNNDFTEQPLHSYTINCLCSLSEDGCVFVIGGCEMMAKEHLDITL